MVRIKEKDNEIRCSECGVTLIWDKEDITYGIDGAACIKCPKCGEKIYLDGQEHDLKITPENILFPDHFYSFENGTPIEREEVTKWVEKVLEILQNNPDQPFACTGSGNTIVIAIQYDDEINIHVCPKYYECTVFKDENE